MARILSDLLKLLAHGAITTGGAVLGDMLTQPMREQSAMRQQFAKQLIGGLGALPEEALGPASNKLVELMGKKGALPQYQAPTGNVIGPNGESLAITPAPGVELPKETIARFVRPEISSDAVLGAALASDPEKQRQVMAIKAGGYSQKDLADLLYKERNLQETIKQRETTNKHHDAVLAQTASDKAAAREESKRFHDLMANQWNTNLDIKQSMNELRAKSIQNEEAAKAYRTLMIAHDKVQEAFREAQKYNFKNISGITTAIDAHNNLLSSVQGQFKNVPEIAGYRALEMFPGTKTWTGGFDEKPELRPKSLTETPTAKPVVPPVSGTTSSSTAPKEGFKGPDGKIYKVGDKLPNGKPLQYINGQWVY